MEIRAAFFVCGVVYADPLRASMRAHFCALGADTGQFHGVALKLKALLLHGGKYGLIQRGIVHLPALAATGAYQPSSSA